MRNLMLLNAIAMASAKEGGDNVPAGATTDMVQVTGKTLDGRDVKEGTTIPARMVREASGMLQAFWDIEDRRRGASQMVLNLAADAVRSAEGNYKLALTYFDASIAGAMADFRIAHKDAGKEEKAKIGEFLSPYSSWAQYVSNLRGALSDEFRIVKETTKDPSKWALVYPSEHALRTARTAAKLLKNHARTATQKLADRLDMSDLKKEDIEEARMEAIELAPKDADEKAVKELVEQRLIAKGAVLKDEAKDEEDDADETEAETEAAKVHTLSEQYSARIMGKEPAYATQRESFAKLIRMVASIDLDKQGEELVGILENACVRISKLALDAQKHGEKLADRVAANAKNAAKQGAQVVTGP